MQLVEIGSVRVDIHETFVSGLGIGGKGSMVALTLRQLTRKRSVFLSGRC